MNQCIFIGNLTRDPETRIVSDGKTVCNFTIAVNRRGGGQNEVDYVRVAAWGKTGENCQRYLAKGRKVCVSGSVSAHAYQANDGTTKANLELMARDVEFLTAKGESGTSAPAQNAAPQAQEYTSVVDDELPF